jgi:hypothetical protein
MNHNLNIALVIFFSLVLVGMVGWPFVKRWYYSRLKTPFEITLKGRTYWFHCNPEDSIVDQMARQDKLFDEFEARRNASNKNHLK